MNLHRTQRSDNTQIRRLAISAVVALAVIVFLAGCRASNPSGLRLVEPETAARDTQETTFQDSAPTSALPSAEATPEGTSEISSETSEQVSAQTPVSIPTTAPLQPPTPTVIAAPTGATEPALAQTPEAIAQQINQALDEILATHSQTPATETAATGTGTGSDTASTTHYAPAHLHNLAMLKLGSTPEWDDEVFAALDTRHHNSVRLHLKARRALVGLSAGYDAADYIPAWRIIAPAPAHELLSYYKAAENETGIEWEYLAAINLIETGMGRIVGLSSAGAKGPMQFMPTTWEEHGIGAGDINNPADAIPAAARYLVRRGGPENMDQALWGYNNHDAYVEAVKAYAELLRQDETQYHVIHGWEIYFHTEAGAVWLPVGFETEKSIDLYEYLEQSPWVTPQ